MNHTETKTQEIRSAAVAAALEWGLDPDAFEIAWDEAPAQMRDGSRFAMPEEIKEKASPQQTAFWSRIIERSDGKKPKTIQELNKRIVEYLEKQSELGYAHLLPEPSGEGLLPRYQKIRDASPEEAAEYPPDWQAIRTMGEQNLKYSLEIAAKELLKIRAGILKESADYMLEEMKLGNYAPAEVAEVLAWSAKTRLDLGDNGTVRSVKITKNNEALPLPITGALASKTIGKMREGTNTQAAVAEALAEIAELRAQRKTNFTGWRKYEQSGLETDAQMLNEDLSTTNWCTGGHVGTAKMHLSKGPFYVYFIEGEPLIAIRTTNNNVAEIRGRGQGQQISDFELKRDGEQRLISGQELKEEAERYLLSEKGPKKGENYLWDQQMRRALAAFQKDGIADPILLECLDQTGKLIPERFRPKMGGYGQGTFEPDIAKAFTEKKWLPSELAETDSEGNLHLKTSYIAQFRRVNRMPGPGEEEEVAVLPYTSIAGSLEGHSEIHIDASKLRRCGKIHISGGTSAGLLLTNLEEVKDFKTGLTLIGGLPNLRRAESLNFVRDGVEEDGTPIKNLHLNKLVECRRELMSGAETAELDSLETCGSLILTNATSVKANRLKTCGKMDIASAEVADLESLEIVGNLFAENLLKGKFPNLKKAKQMSLGVVETLEVGNLEAVDRLHAPLLQEWNTPKLQETGDIFSQCTSLRAPNLRIAGKIETPKATVAELSALCQAEGMLLDSAADLDFQNLRTCGKIYSREGKSLNAPSLESAGQIWLSRAESANLEALESVEKLHLPKVVGIHTPLLRAQAPAADTRMFTNTKGDWLAKVQNGRVILNAATITAGDVRPKIAHELAHLVYNDPKVKSALKKLFASIPEGERKKIRTAIQGKYPNEQLAEEAHVRAFESLARLGEKNLLRRLLEEIGAAWNRLTNSKALPREKEQALVNLVLQTGIEALRPERKKELAIA